MKYDVLGFVAHEGDNDVLTEEINRQEYERVKKLKSDCFFALRVEEKFALLFDNYSEFEFELLRLAECGLIWRDRARDHSDAMRERLLLDRRLVNLLTSCRLYLDQSEHGLSRLFGNPSSALTTFKQCRSKQYDSVWGYRFMEALRNHVQYSALASNSIAHACFISCGVGENYTEHTVYPTASIKVLKENPDFKQTVLDEIGDEKDAIDLRGPVREYISCFVTLHSELRNIISSQFAVARGEYLAAVQRYHTIAGEKAFGGTLRELRDDGTKVNEIPLVTHFIDYYDKLLAWNTVNDKIRCSTASNTDQKRD